MKKFVEVVVTAAPVGGTTIILLVHVVGLTAGLISRKEVTMYVEDWPYDTIVNIQIVTIKIIFFILFIFCCPTRLAFRSRPVFYSGRWPPLLKLNYAIFLSHWVVSPLAFADRLDF